MGVEECLVMIVGCLENLEGCLVIKKLSRLPEKYRRESVEDVRETKNGRAQSTPEESSNSEEYSEDDHKTRERSFSREEMYRSESKRDKRGKYETESEVN